MQKFFFSIASILFIGFLSLSSCNSGPVEEPCPFGDPKPILNKDTKGVANYSFSAQNMRATERFSVPDFLIDFELLQSGCENVTQEIRITVLPYQGQLSIPPNAEQTALYIGEIFTNLSDLDPTNEGLILLKEWGITVAQLAANFEYKTAVEAQPNSGLMIEIDQYKNPESLLLTLKIFNQADEETKG